MSFSYISNLLFIFILVFLLSCQNSKISNNNVSSVNDIKVNYEENENLDLSFYEFYEKNIIDYYTNQSVTIDFLDEDITKLKINSYESKIKNNNPINIIYDLDYVYSINFKGEILKFNSDTGKLIDRIIIDLDYLNNSIPVSFSLLENDFIIGFKSGHIMRINKNAEILWVFDNSSLLNTPIKVTQDYIIILYSEDLIILSPLNGEIIFQKNYNSNNVIQSIGGKIVEYFNILYFILPNSDFHSIDTFLFNEHLSNLDNLELKTSLNNLYDNIYIYKNILLYVDNGKTISTFDIINNNFLLSNYKINDLKSYLSFNNSLIAFNGKLLLFYNIKNGKLFFNVEVSDILNEKSKIIKAIIINNKLHIFSENGKIIILNNENKIEKVIDLKIKNINFIYNYNNKIFISNDKGMTYIF